MTPSFPKLPDWVVKAHAPKPTAPRKPTTLPSPLEAEGYRRQALADLCELRELVAGLTDGRHQAPFFKACSVGKYLAHKFLREAEIEDALLDASEANGALAKYALKDVLKQIRNGLRYSRNDPLPPLHSKHRGLR